MPYPTDDHVRAVLSAALPGPEENPSDDSLAAVLVEVFLDIRRELSSIRQALNRRP